MAENELNPMAELVQEVRALRETIAHIGKASDKYTRPLTREEAADYLQVHKDTLYRWSIEGLVAYSRIGDGPKAQMRFTKADLDEALRLKRVGLLSEAS